MRTAAAPPPARAAATAPAARRPRARKAPAPALIQDPKEAAKAAGLRYVTDAGPGIRRQKAGKRFRYIGVDGAPIRDKAEIERIERLGIPPAYTNVWICPLRNGHLQATGYDARGRKQYRYHPRWREARDENKYERMMAFGEALPRIRARVEEDLARPGLPREKALATVVRLLETTCIRVGNEEYAKQNDSYGLTTLRNEHVEVEGGKIHFHFRGKSGKEHAIDLKDPRLARIVKKMRDIPGHELFQYVDENGERRTIDSGDVNAYLHEIAGAEFTAKDFRTWAGTVLCALTLREFVGDGEGQGGLTETQAKKNVVQAIKTVAERLGNTPAICRKCYVHPAVLDTYLDGTMRQALGERVVRELTSGADGGNALAPDEAAIMNLLRSRLANPPATEAAKKAA
jgi:DNA topoisomerase-1